LLTVGVQDHLTRGVERAHQTFVGLLAVRLRVLSTVGLFAAKYIAAVHVTRPRLSGTEMEEPFALLRRWPIAAFACAARGELLQRSFANPFPRFWCTGTTDRGWTSYALHFGAVKYENV
jgi:hypothetical protein